MSNTGGGRDMDVNKNVEFLYKSMMTRDPRKRQVKLVKPHLMQLDFGSLEDSSDDSDFKLNSDADDDDDDIDDEDDEGANNNRNVAESGDSDNSDEEEDDDDGDDDEDDDKSGKEKRKNSDNEEIADKENPKKKMKPNSDEVVADDDGKLLSVVKGYQQDDEALIKTYSINQIVVPVCSVCLGDSNQSSNEIVECDGCHVTVHEGCFGVSDCHSTTSSDSSSSMEPWFCDSCKAGVQPHCELCPNRGGIFKETDSGRWVHLICALYTKGVAFGDVERLNNITLFEMPYAKWGAKECSLCEDPRFRRTGVCISCDAGMCRVHFHVTCAQRQGLLTEASPEEANAIADPYFAYCKIHADKHSMRSNHRNWLALQSNFKRGDKDRGLKEKDKLRFQRKLSNHQLRYQDGKYCRPSCWVPKEKMPRMLLSNSYALKQLLRKAEMQGVTEDVSVKDTRKRGYIPPAFSVDFVSYYLERNEQMEGLKSKCKEMEKQAMEMKRAERQVSAKMAQLKHESQSLITSSGQTQRSGLTLWDYMMNIAGRRIRIPECVSFRNFARSPVKNGSNMATHSKQSLKCSICNQSHDKHLLATCDRCHSGYHLGCLDPPLTRMPKKTKLQGWQCSQCSKEEDVDTLSQPRTLREKRLIREPLKYTTQFHHENKIRYQKEKKRKSNPTPSTGQSNEGNSKITSLPSISTFMEKPSSTGINVIAESPFSISSEEDDEYDDEEEEEENDEAGSKSDYIPSSDDGSSADEKSRPIEIVQGVQEFSKDHLSTGRNQPLNLNLGAAGVQNVLDLSTVTNQKQVQNLSSVTNQKQVQNLSSVTNQKQGLPNVVTILQPTSQMTQFNKSQLKKVILAKVICPDNQSTQEPTNPNVALKITQAHANTLSSKVKIVTAPLEKKLPIIIKKKPTLLPEANRVAPIAMKASDRLNEFIEISDED